MLALVLWSCIPSFCPLSRSSLGALLANVVLFRVFGAFQRVLWGFVWVCVVLVICVACGAFVRVNSQAALWLVACLPSFFLYLPSLLSFLPSFCPVFILFVLLCSGCLSLSSCIVFVALWVWLLFPFPFRTTRKKKGRAVLVRPLLVCRERSNSCNVIEELRGRCFGSF